MSSSEKEKWKKDRERISQEIVDTETTYVASLEAIVQIYIEPLESAQKPLIKKEDCECIFGGITALYQLHIKFLSDLQKKIKAGELCGSEFLAFIPYFKMYTQYINKHSKASELLEKYIGPKAKKGKKFRKIAQAGLQDTRCRGNNLVSLLIMPIQRIPRYKLLLEQLLKKTEESDPGRDDLEKALAAVDDVAKHINESVRVRETSEELLMIQSQFEVDTKLVLVEPGRIFVRRGWARVAPPAESMTSGQTKGGASMIHHADFSHLILFNDLLLEVLDLTRKKEKEKEKEKIIQIQLTLRKQISFKVSFAALHSSCFFSFFLFFSQFFFNCSS